MNLYVNEFVNCNIKLNVLWEEKKLQTFLKLSILKITCIKAKK